MVRNSTGGLVILVSYAGIEGESTMDMGDIRRMYALVRLSSTGGIFRVENVGSVPYQNVSEAGHLNFRLT
jgi:hypothetical protein